MTLGVDLFSSVGYISNWEIIFKPNQFGGSKFYLIYPDPLMSAHDLSLSTLTGSTFDQIQP